MTAKTKKLFRDIKTRRELRTRVVDGVLSVGCHYLSIRHLLSEESGRGLKQVKVIYSAASGGMATIVRYL